MNKNDSALTLFANAGFAFEVAGFAFEVIYQGEDSDCPVCKTTLGATPRAA